MHKIFGIKEDAEYYDREGAYLIPVCNNKVGIVETHKGYFFLGGGLENGESYLECIKRECLEEAGYIVSVGEKVCTAETYCKHPTIGHFHPMQAYYIGDLVEKVAAPIDVDHHFLWVDYDYISGKMFSEMQNWALEKCFDFAQKIYKK
ncbi:MAG: NUDIX domain-containing protein [Ruminococcaceae bacterium]|nr:NUDIX domain-containing protein [Oscillospiraceae bacterium]